MNPAPLVVLILSIWGAIVDSRYKRNGGKRPTRRAKVLFLSAFLVVALFATVMLTAPLKPGREESVVHAIAGLTTTILILFFGAWELGRWRARIKNPAAHLVQDRKEREGHRGLKLLILAALVAVLGYFYLEKSASIPSTSETATTNKPDSVATPPQTVTTPLVNEATQKQLLECIEVSQTDTWMVKSKDQIISSPSGDLRPVWTISGRVRNSCPSDFSDLILRVEAFRKNTDEQLDSAEVVLHGTTSAFSTRGFVQNVQLRIPRPDYDWNMTPVGARLAK